MTRKRRKQRRAPSRTRPRPDAATEVVAPEPGDAWRAPWLVVPVAVALVIRLVHLAAVSEEPALGQFLILDAELYAKMAEIIIGGDWLGGPGPFSVGPLYAYVLALIRTLAASNLAVFALQTLVGVASVGIVTLLARRLSSRMGAAVAGTGFAAYAPTVMLETKLLGETFAVFAVLLSTFLLAGTPTLRRTVGAGASFGAACLLRPDLTLFVPLGIWWVARCRGEKLRDAATQGARPWTNVRGWDALSTLAWVAPVIVVLGLSTARNWVVTGEPIAISAQGGVSLYQGNNPRAEGTFSLPAGFSGNKLDQEREAKALAERHLGRPLSHREVDGYWSGRAVDYLWNHPKEAVTLLGRKLIYFLASAELSGEYSVLADRCLTPTLFAAFVPFGVFLAGAALGVPVGLRADQKLSLLLLLVAAAGLVTALLFFVSSRYRLTAAAHLAVFLGPGYDGFARALKERRYRPLGVALALVLVSFLPARDAERYQAAVSLYNLGGRQYERAHYEDAIRYYLAAVAVRSKDWELRYNLGQAFAVVGDYDRATEQFERVLELNPSSAEARSTLLRYQDARRGSSEQRRRQPLCDL
jgi:hypothetical protein